MQGYRISDLDSKTQELIKKEKIDQNNDGLINKDNGELAQLLSKAKVSDIQQLGKEYNRMLGLLTFELLGGAATGLSWEYVNHKYQNKNNLAQMFPNMQNAINKENPVIHKDSIPPTHPNMRKSITRGIYEYAKCFNYYKGIKGKFARAAIIGFSMLINPITMAFAVPATVLYMDSNKQQRYKVDLVGDENSTQQITPQKPTQSQTVEQDTLNKETEKEFEKAFENINETKDYTLKEYTPQRGEYWISILKAKYETDDATALKMAHIIKEMIYDDSTASKQSPVMYLPDVWKFEGKTYHYNEIAVPQTTDKFSPDATTDMGKMSPDLKY